MNGPKEWKRKFRNQPVRTAEGYFASKKELADWQGLKMREQAGQIERLQRQVKFSLSHGGVHICDYIADAVFFENGKRVVFDSKGYETPEFRLKKKLMLALLNIHVVTA